MLHLNLAWKYTGHGYMCSSSDEVDILRILGDGERAENFWKYHVERGQ